MDNPLKQVRVSDRGFLFDPSSGEAYSVNGTGLAIVRMLQRGDTPESIAELLHEKFDVDRDRSLDDVREFLSLMRNLGLRADA